MLNPPEQIQEIFVDRINDPAHAMREDIKDQSLYELADNIKQNGLINPITVRPVGDHFEVVAGHRRFTACKIIGIIKIKAVVRVLTDKEAFAVMAAENLERKDVNIIDEANFIRQYMEQSGEDEEATAKALRRGREYVRTRLLIGEMPMYMQNYLKSGDLKLGVALALYAIDNEVLREKWIHLAVEQGISVPTAQYQANDYKANKALYDGIVKDNPDGADAVQPKPIMMRCFLDGKEYDVRLCKSVIVAECNMPYLIAVSDELKKPAPAPNPPPS